MPRSLTLIVTILALIIQGESRALAQSAPSGSSQTVQLGRPTVAANSQQVGDGRPPADDARWLEHPFSLGGTALLGGTHKMNPLWVVGMDFDYALPYVSLSGTVGYLFGVNAALSARGRLHLGHAVALTLGGRAAIAPVSEGGCWLVDEGLDSLGDPENCPENHWSRAFFAGPELGVEGRSERGFIWRTGLGVMRELARGGYSCTQHFSGACFAATDNIPGTVITTFITLGHSF